MFMALVDGNSQISIAWGITAGLLASFVQSLGLTIQRKSHVLNQQLPEAEQRVEHRRPLWLLGFAIFFSSNIIGSLVQIASLPVVILAPLGAVSLLWNAFFARLLLGDVFSPWMILGTVLIAGGAILIAIFGIVPEPTHSLEDLLHLFGRAAFIAYFSLLGLVVLMCLIVTHLTEFSWQKRMKLPPSTPPLSARPISPSISSISAPLPSRIQIHSEQTPLIDRKAALLSRPSTPTPFVDVKIARTRLLLAISYASVSGILSGMCLIFAKSGVELLLLTVGGKNQFWRWEAWMLLVGLAVFALLQLWYLHKSLIFADPTIVCPLAFCFYNISSIVNGLVYFDQFVFLTALQLSLVSLGMVILLGGVWLVSFHAGSGRVDVGTWEEGDDDLEAEETQNTILPSESYTVERHSPRQLESAVSESDMSLPTPFSPPRHSITFPATPEASQQDHEHLTHTLSPSSPSGRSKRHRRRYSILQPSESSSSALNMPAGGFSIGLSPISPGFAIHPKRRVSGLRGIVDRAAMRRTVSENDVGGSLPTVGGGEPNDTPSPVPEEANRRNRVKAKARWKWLRNVFMDRDS